MEPNENCPGNRSTTCMGIVKQGISTAKTRLIRRVAAGSSRYRRPRATTGQMPATNSASITRWVVPNVSKVSMSTACSCASGGTCVGVLR